MEHEIKGVIRECDLAIKQEDFDALMDYYCEDAILVVKPGRIARGKQEIKDAFIKISQYFHNSLVPTQGEMLILEAGDTALVLSQTLLDAEQNEQGFSMDRRATYVFKKNSQGKWLCAIDNSYGTDLINTL